MSSRRRLQQIPNKEAITRDSLDGCNIVIVKSELGHAEHVVVELLKNENVGEENSNLPNLLPLAVGSQLACQSLGTLFVLSTEPTVRSF